MSFTVTIPGDPPSWNHAYKDVVITRNGAKVRTRAKTEDAVNYQIMVNLIVKAAIPTGWTPADQIRVVYDFAFKRNRDCDNAMKLLNDAIARALGVNDMRFLPTVRCKHTGVSEPFVRISIEEVSPGACGHELPPQAKRRRRHSDP